MSHLHVVLGRKEVPQALLRDRLALRAAEACVGFSGRPERTGELRDAVAFLQPGDLPGPAGESYLAWRHAVERPVSVRVLGRALSTLEQSQIAKSPPARHCPQDFCLFGVRPVWARFQAFSCCQFQGMRSSMRLIL
ncbi:MAG: DUF1403 family protein [Loktanella sp.]|nr:DUF1403 family protein [Loktanella sp.]